MSAKKIILKIVIGLIAVAVLVLIAVLLSRPSEENEANEEITVFTSNAEDISLIEIMGEDAFTLEKGEDGWVMQGMEDVPLVSNLPETLASSLANVTSPMLVERNASDLSQYGLDEPRARVRLVFPDDEETFLVGNDSGDYYYFRIEPSKDVYIVSYDTLYLTMIGKMGFLSKTVFTVSEDSVTKIAYGDIVLERSGEEWKEITPYDMPADTNSVETVVLSPISSIVASEILSEVKSPAHGTTLEVTTQEGTTRLDISKEADGYRYITREDSEYIYKVKTDALSFLDISGFDIMSLYIAPIDISDVSEIYFEAPEKTDVLSIEAPSSEAPVFSKNGEEADETNFRDFYQVLASLQFKSEGKAQGEAEYSITFTLEDGSIYKIEFVPMTDSEYAVRINGRGDFTVLKKSVTDLFGYIENIKTV